MTDLECNWRPLAHAVAAAAATAAATSAAAATTAAACGKVLLLLVLCLKATVTICYVQRAFKNHLYSHMQAVIRKNNSMAAQTDNRHSGSHWPNEQHKRHQTDNGQINSLSLLNSNSQGLIGSVCVE
jgi:ABC-type sugar transport system substrate-binding protein